MAGKGNNAKLEFGLPSTTIITGRSGSGKTYLLRQLLGSLIKNKQFKCNFGYEDPAKRVIYIGQYTPQGERSGDEEHNKVIEDILALSPEPAETYSYLDAQKEANDQNEDGADLAAMLGRSGDSATAMSIVMKKINETVKDGDIIIFDDLQ